jgi:beta-lactamase class A
MITTRATWTLMVAAWLLAYAGGSAQADLRARWTAMAAAGQGRVGAAAVVLEGGAPVALAGDERFPMQSVFKFPIAMAALAQVDAGRLRLDQPVAITPADFAHGVSPIRDAHPGGVTLPLEDVLRSSVAFSDNTACDVVLRVIGGPAAADAFVRGLGIDGIAIVASEKAMGAAHEVQYRNYATPNAMVALLRAFHDGRGLSAASRERLRGWMVDTPTGPKRLKGALPAGTVVAHKTGTSGTVAGVTAATNDVGLVTLPDGRHLAIAVFVADARGNEAAREGVIAGLARAAWDAWATP